MDFDKDLITRASHGCWIVPACMIRSVDSPINSPYRREGFRQARLMRRDTFPSWFGSLNGTFVPLLAALVIVAVAAPLATGMPVVSTILVSFVLVAGVFAVHGSPLLRQGAVAAFVAVLALRWLAHIHGEEHQGMVIAAHLAICMYMILLGWMCVSTVLRRETITRDAVLGAVCGYIVIAYVFTFAYAVLEDISPGSLSNAAALPDHHADKAGRMTPDLLYFSFVTLTTVGYGDIIPAHRAARSLAILEMLTGQLYLAAFVARLVAMMSARHSGRRDDSSDRAGP
jgi:hypothetical protein